VRPPRHLQRGHRIRQATPEDAGNISALIHALAPDLLADPSDLEAAAPFFATITPEAIAAAISGGQFVYHVAPHRAGLRGAIALRHLSHLYHLFVAKEFQGRGLASALWRTARAHAEGPIPIERFTVNASLPAVPVYTHLGFAATGPAAAMHGLVFVPMALVRPPGPATA
jgi:GNAT superfamily N-acetyltransferase